MVMPSAKCGAGRRDEADDGPADNQHQRRRVRTKKMLDTLLEGVETAAAHAVQFCDGGYTTYVPLDDITGGKPGSCSPTTENRSSRSTATPRPRRHSYQESRAGEAHDLSVAPTVTGRPSCSAERHAASVSSSERRLWRAELYGSRSSAIAEMSSAMAPANPSGHHSPSSG
jgi:hypothetical protein